IEWKPENEEHARLLTLRSLASKFQLLAAAAIKTFDINGRVFRFVGMSTNLFDDKLDPKKPVDPEIVVYIQESELSNAQALALGLEGKKNADEFPYLTKSPDKAIDACAAIGLHLHLPVDLL